MLRVRPETERQMDRRGCSQMWATAKYSATWGIRQLPGMCWHPAKRSICRGEPSSPTNLMQQLRASGSGADLLSASPCNDKKWTADTMYRPPLLFSVVKNGFQGVPERYKWVPHAMLANRRFRAGYPLRGLCTADKGAVALGNVQEIRVQLFILPYQNQYFVLSSCDIIGSSNLCAVF